MRLFCLLNFFFLKKKLVLIFIGFLFFGNNSGLVKPPVAKDVLDPCKEAIAPITDSIPDMAKDFIVSVKRTNTHTHTHTQAHTHTHTHTHPFLTFSISFLYKDPDDKIDEVVENIIGGAVSAALEPALPEF